MSDFLFWMKWIKTPTRFEKLLDPLGQLVSLLRFHSPVTISYLSRDLWAAWLWASVAVGVGCV